jgi:hypothetical protein
MSDIERGMERQRKQGRRARVIKATGDFFSGRTKRPGRQEASNQRTERSQKLW